MCQELVLESLKFRSSDVFHYEERCLHAASFCAIVGALFRLVLRNRMHVARVARVLTMKATSLVRLQHTHFMVGLRTPN